MNELEAFATEQIKRIVPEFEKLELRATIGDTSRSVEFFVTIKGERKQCFELADDGVFSDAALDRVFEAIAEFIRNDNEYKKGEVNIRSAAARRQDAMSMRAEMREPEMSLTF
jgi:hypothetical protein